MLVAAGSSAPESDAVHLGPVGVIETYNNRLWSSGGSSQACSMIEWDLGGTSKVECDVTESGELRALILAIAQWEAVRSSCGERLLLAQLGKRGPAPAGSEHGGLVNHLATCSMLLVVPTSGPVHGCPIPRPVIAVIMGKDVTASPQDCSCLPLRAWSRVVHSQRAHHRPCLYGSAIHRCGRRLH